MNKRNIGQNIRTLRQQCGMTQAQIAEETGVTTDHISHVEIGSGSVSLPLLLEMCKLMDVTPNDILAGEYTPEPSEENSSLGEKVLKDKTISFKNVNPDDRVLLNYLYQFMINRKRDS